MTPTDTGAKKTYRPMTKTERQQILMARRRGMTIIWIAEFFHRARSHIETVCNKAADSK